MLIIIEELKNGMKLTKDIYSSLGGILFKKGSILKEQDKEILEAFGVKEVDVLESNLTVQQSNSNEKLNNNLNKDKDVEKTTKRNDSFEQHFNQAIKYIDKILRSARGNIQIPVMEVRELLTPLLTEEYQQVKYLSRLRYLHNDNNKYESYHSLSVGLIAHAIARWLDLDKKDWMQVALAGVFHDIGMSRIPSNIMDYKGSLNNYEFNEVKKHTIYGYQILKGTQGLNEGVLLAALQHHERGDISGYPQHLQQTKIHLYAKIVAVADVFHAMISKRNYRSEYSIYQAIDQIINDGFGKLDPLIVRVFTQAMTQFTNGSKVILNNGEEGVIVFVDENNPTRPMVKTPRGIINLYKETHLSIEDVII